MEFDKYSTSMSGFTFFSERYSALFCRPLFQIFVNTSIDLSVCSLERTTEATECGLTPPGNEGIRVWNVYIEGDVARLLWRSTTER